MAPDTGSEAISPGAGKAAKSALRRRGWNAEEGHPRPRHVLAVLVTVAFMAQLDLFIVNIAVPAMSRSFHGAGLSDLSWVLNAYAIVFAALLVPVGRLADHFGRRRFILVGIVVFTLASAGCAIAPTIALLVTGRVVQAVGAALIIPSSLGLLLPVFPTAQHSKVVGIWAGVAAVASLSGPPLGGLLVGVDWRWIFVINLPIGVAAFLAGFRVLPEVHAGRSARLPDLVSTLSLLLAICLLILTTVEAPDWGWSATKTIVLLVLAVLATAVTVLRSLRHPHALIEATLFRNREFATATIAMFLFFVAFASWLLVTVLFLQDAWHYSAIRSGLAIAPAPACASLLSVNSGRITARFGRTAPVVAGIALIVAGAAFWIAVTPLHPSYAAGFLPGLILAGIGSGLAQPPLFAAASTLPADRATTGSGVLNMSRQVGSAIGIAVLVTLGSARPGSLDLYHRSWILMIVVALAAAVTLLAGRCAVRSKAP